MSTILDALRKIEEERRSRTADVRSRLLLSSPFKTTLPSQLPQAQRKTRLTLPLVLGFTVASVAAGAGVILWRSQHNPRTLAQNALQPTSIAPPPSATVSSGRLPNAHKDLRTETSAPPTTQAPTPQRQQSPTPSAPALVQEDLPPTPPGGSAVQRSPFTAPPPPKEPPPKPRVTAAAPVAPPPTESSAMREWHRRHPLPPQTRTAPPAQTLAPPDTKSVATEDLSVPAGTTLSMLQWSNDPEKRLAFLRVNGGPLTMAHEGDMVGGYKVMSIQQNGVELQSGESRMMLHAR